MKNSPESQADKKLWTVFEVAPDLLEVAKRRGHDFTASEFGWTEPTSNSGFWKNFALVQDGKEVAIVFETEEGRWIAGDSAGSPLVLRPVALEEAKDLAVRSALLLFTPVRDEQV